MANNMGSSQSKHAQDFERVVTWASALSIAIATGFLASLKQVNPSIVIHFSFLSVIAFFAGGTVTILFFRWLMRRANANDPAKRGHWGILITIVAVGTLLGCLFFATKNVSSQHQKDVMFGTSLAAVVLTFVGVLCWRIVRFLESEDQKQNEGENSERLGSKRP